MSGPSRPASRKAFEIGVICASDREWDAVETLFDLDWEETQKYPKAPNDPNAYSMGRIGNHNIVLAPMPGMGKKNATSVATHFTYSFPNIKLGLVVGICGGVPSALDIRNQIFLGDIVISTVVVQYDFGWQYPDKLVPKDTLLDRLGRPNQVIRAFLAQLQSRKACKRFEERTSAHLTSLLRQDDFMSSRYPGVENDILWESTYRHKHHNVADCSICASCMKENDAACDLASLEVCLKLGCDVAKQVRRARSSALEAGAEAPKPVVHFGTVASGDSVMKSSSHRDKLIHKEGVIAFEMEGAGVWENLPSVVIKGISDYSDSHKDFRWQWYAAAGAAACMKAFLEQWRVTDKTSQSEWEFIAPALINGNTRQVSRTTQGERAADREAENKSKISKEVDIAYSRIHQPDDNITKEGLVTVQQTFKQVLDSLTPLEPSFLQRIYWSLMTVEKLFGCYEEFTTPQKIEHIEMAESYSNKLMQSLPQPISPSLQAQVALQQKIIKGQEAILKSRRKGNATDVNRTFCIPKLKQAELKDRTI